MQPGLQDQQHEASMACVPEEEDHLLVERLSIINFGVCVMVGTVMGVLSQRWTCILNTLEPPSSF